MAAFSKEDVRKKSLEQLEAHASEHPSEGLMIATETGKTVKNAMGKYLTYQKNKAINIICPGFNDLVPED